MNRFTSARSLLAGIALVLLSSVAGAHEARVGDLVLVHPWIRLPPPVAQTAAGYLVVRNTGSQADRLVEVRGDAAKRIEVHASSMENGVMSMHHVPAVELPAGAEVRFEHGGLHVMLIGVQQKLEEGARVPLTLVFEKAGEVSAEFVVQRGAGH